MRELVMRIGQAVSHVAGAPLRWAGAQLERGRRDLPVPPVDLSLILGGDDSAHDVFEGLAKYGLEKRKADGAPVSAPFDERGDTTCTS